MRKLSYLLGLVCLLSASSCAGTKYKHCSFESSQNLRGGRNGFVYSAYDSLEVMFSWRNMDAIELDVYNGSRQPVWINWERSQVSVNDVSQPNPYQTRQNKLQEKADFDNMLNLAQDINKKQARIDSIQESEPDTLAIERENLPDTLATERENLPDTLATERESLPDSLSKDAQALLQKKAQIDSAAVALQFLANKKNSPASAPPDVLIPPQSQRHYSLPMKGLEDVISYLHFTPVNYKDTNVKYPRAVGVKQFRRWSSPFTVRVRLAYQKGRNDGNIIDQEFWLHEVVETEYSDIRDAAAGRQEPYLDERTFNKVRHSKEIVHSHENFVAVLAVIGGVIKLIDWASHL